MADRAVRICRDTAHALSAAEVTPEALAEFVPEVRRLLVFRRPATMQPVGEVWRLGALLLDTDGGLYALGRATRAAERGRVGYQSLSREERRDLAAAALRGGYAEGTTVNFDATPLPLTAAALQALSEDAPMRGPGSESTAPSAQTGTTPASEPPIGVHNGEVRVRWRAGAPLEGAVTLEQYVRERADLLIHPPLGAS